MKRIMQNASSSKKDNNRTTQTDKPRLIEKREKEKERDGMMGGVFVIGVGWESPGEPARATK